MRAVQRAVIYLQQNTLSSRDTAAILGELDQLADLSGMPTTGHRVVDLPPVPTRISVEEGQELNMTVLRSRIRGATPAAVEFNVRFEVGGAVYEVPLDQVPDGSVRFSSDAAWLQPS